MGVRGVDGVPSPTRYGAPHRIRGSETLVTGQRPLIERVLRDRRRNVTAGVRQEGAVTCVSWA